MEAFAGVTLVMLFRGSDVHEELRPATRQSSFAVRCILIADQFLFAEVFLNRFPSDRLQEISGLGIDTGRISVADR